MATHSSILACRIPRTEEPGGLQSMGSQGAGHDWVTNTFTFTLPSFRGWPDGQHWNQIWLYSLQPRWRSSIQSTKTRPGDDYGSDHELLIAKFRLKLKKVGKTTRSFRYNLNQIPYNYAVEVRNRFKGLDLIERVPDEPWTEVHDIVQETGIKTIPMEKKCKKQNGCLGRPYK